MASSRLSLTLRVKVDPTLIADLEAVAQEAQALADRLRAMQTEEGTPPTPRAPSQTMEH